MLNERILKNKEFFVFKSLKENFKEDLLKDLRPKVQTEPINKLTDQKLYDKNELKRLCEKTRTTNQNKQPSSNYFVAEPINIEPVDSSLFFKSSLFHTKGKQNFNEDYQKDYLNKNQFDLTSINQKFNENIRDNNLTSEKAEKLSRKIRKKKRKCISKKTFGLDLNENDDHLSPGLTFEEKNVEEAQYSSKKQDEDFDLNQRKFNTLHTPEEKHLIYGNSITAFNNSLASTSTPPPLSSTVKLSQTNNSLLNSKSLKNNKKNKNNKNNNRRNNTFYSHNNESSVDLSGNKSQDYDSINRNFNVPNKQQQSLLETESISKAGLNFNNANNNFSETNNEPPLLPKNNDLDKSIKNNQIGKQTCLPFLVESRINKSTTTIKTEEALAVPIKIPSTKKLSRKMKLINNLTENKSSLLSDISNNTSENKNYRGPNNSNALKFLNCLEKNKNLLKKFYENIDWDKIKEEEEEEEDELKRTTDEEIELDIIESTNNDTMKLQLKEKSKNYYQGNNNPYRASGGIVSGIGSPSSKGLHWINIATTNTGLRKANINSKSELSTGNAANEIIRIINNVTSMSVDSAGLTNTSMGPQGLEAIMSPSSENFNSNITISSIGPKNKSGNKLHFLKVDGQRVDYLHSIQSNGVARKSQSSFGMPNQSFKMSYAKASSIASTVSSSTNSTPSASASSSSTSAAILANSALKKGNTNIIDLSNYRNITNLDFIKQAVRENFEVKDNIKLPDLSAKNLDSSLLSNHANSDKEVFELANSTTSSNKTTNLTENDLLEYFKNKRKAKTQSNLFLKIQNAHQRANTSINNFIRGETCSNLNDDLIVMSNEHLDKDRHSESPSPHSPSNSSMNVSANLMNFSNRTNKLKKRLNRIRNKSNNQSPFSVSVGTNTYPGNKKFFTDPINAVTSASKDAKVVKEIRNMYETSLNKGDFSNNLDMSMNDNTATNINNNNVNINSGRLLVNDDIEKNRGLFNLSRNEVIDIINNNHDVKDIEHREALIKNSRCSYNNTHVDNEKDEGINVTSIIRELKENELKESIKIEQDEIDDKRKNTKSSDFSLGLNIDTIASKLLVFDMENIPNLNKVELEKTNENKESSIQIAHKIDNEISKSPERRMSKTDNEKTITSMVKDQPKLIKNLNSTKFNTNNLIQKISITSKKNKNSSISFSKNSDIDQTKISESPLSRSAKIYTHIANSSVQPLHEEISDENDLDLNISDYQLLPNNENEFIKKQLEANRLQRKIFKRLRIENSSYSHPNSLVSTSAANFNSNSVLNNYTNQTKLNIYDCYKYYERTKNFE